MIPAFMLGVWSALVFAAACFVAARLSGQLRSVPARPLVVPLMIEEEAMEQEQLTFDSYEEAIAAKEAVLTEVITHNKNWMAQAVAKFHELKHLLPDDFIGEDISLLLTKEGGIEHRANAWGPLVNILQRGKQIEATGTVRAMKVKGKNARRSFVYRLASIRELEPA